MAFSLQHKTVALALALTTFFGAEAAFAQVAPVEEAGQAPAGFALQASLINAPLALDDKLLGFNTLEGGLMLGYKFDRFIFGLGFDFTRYSEGDTNEPPSGGGQTASMTNTYYTFVVYPELQVALARSANRKAELFGTVSVGFGTWDSETVVDPPDPNPNPSPEPDVSRLRVRWRAAPGVRYWVDPHIGLSLSTGFAGNHMMVDVDDTANGGGKSSDSIGVISLFTQLGFVGVF